MKSPTATESGSVPHREVSGRAEASTAVTQQHRYIVGVGVGSHQIGIAVPVEVTYCY